LSQNEINDGKEKGNEQVKQEAHLRNDALVLYETQTRNPFLKKIDAA